MNAAGLLVVDGNPIKDIELVARPDKNFTIKRYTKTPYPQYTELDNHWRLKNFGQLACARMLGELAPATW